MKEPLCFETQEAFRNWLLINSQSSEGVWLKFGKTSELVTLKASEALEEALCFGWIDGLIKKMDETAYLKYFASRRKGSNWSEKNRKLAESLIEQKKMTEFGLQKIEEAKLTGKWEQAAKVTVITTQQIELVSELVKESQLAVTNFQKMPPSSQKTYTRAYFDAKTAAGRLKRLAWLIKRLEKNLKPME